MKNTSTAITANTKRMMEVMKNIGETSIELWDGALKVIHLASDLNLQYNLKFDMNKTNDVSFSLKAMEE